jgi:3',5'-cyclic AMP phosphodiesterase CpdA
MTPLGIARHANADIGQESDLRSYTLNLPSDIHYSTSQFLPRWMPGDPYDSPEQLRRLLKAIGRSNADATIFNGDCTDQGHFSSYKGFERLLQRSAISHAVFTTPGNHDKRKPLADTVRSDQPTATCRDGEKRHFLFQLGPHRIVVLDSAPIREFDSAVGGEPDRGVIGHSGLDWLKAILDAPNIASKVWIVTHYPVHTFGLELLAPHVCMQDGDDLHRLLIDYRGQVGAVFSGHLHCEMKEQRDGITYYSLPPVSVPIAVVRRESGVSKIRDPEGVSAFASITLHPDGDHEYSRHVIL